MANTCDPALDPQSLNWCEGKTNLPGIRRRVYLIAKNKIVAWPKLPETLAAGDDMGKLATYPGNFTLAAEETWKSMEIIEDRSPVTAETQGSKPSKTYLNQAVLVVPNTDAQAAGLGRIALNADYVYLVQQKDGRYRVIGNEMFETNTDVALALGGSVTDEMGTTFTASVTDVVANPFYEGEIITEDGTINEANPDAP